MKTDPALKQIIEEPDITPQPDYVFKVNGKLDPDGCADMQAGVAACSRISSAERSGCSHQNRWPTPSSSSSAAGISAAICSPLATAAAGRRCRG